MMHRHLVAFFCALVAVYTTQAGETARQILDRVKKLDDTTRHWTDRHQRLKLTIYDRRGGERVRELEVYDRRYSGDENKTVVFFLSPAEVKGTAFLSYSHKGKPADQWLYLPELQRVRQITARSRNESFMGTDLSYHDLDLLQEMPSWTEDDAAAKSSPEATVDDTPTHVIEESPKREDIGYQRVILWIGRDDLFARKVEFFGEESEPTKRILQKDVKTVNNIPVAHRQEIETPRNGSRTVVEVSDVQFNQQLEDDLFTQRALERGGR